MTDRLAPTKIAALAVSALLLLSACGGGSSSSSDTAPTDADVVVRALDGISWNAKTFKASAGKVTIFGANDSSIAHNLYVLDSNDKVIGTHIDLPKRGSDGTVVLDLTPGTYHIVCKVPGHTNMNSELKVS